MRPRIRHHVNPLQSKFQGVARAVPLGDDEVEVEIGCADAHFLFERAAAHPRVACIGLEIREDLVRDVNARAADAGLANLRAVFANANTDLDVLFPDGRLARAYVNFPDPWFKRRHHKRRVMTPDLAVLLARKLAPDGRLYFQSDIFDLALDAMAVLEDSGAFDNARGPWSFHPAPCFAARSLRQIKCEERGWPVWRLLFTPRR